MASGGVGYSYGTPGTTNNEYIVVKIEWTSTANASANTSSVTAKMYATRLNTGYTTYGTGSWNIIIDGTSYSISKTVEVVNGSWCLLGSATKNNIAHNSDGSKSITISATGGISGTSWSSTTCSGTAKLDTISQSASTFTLSSASVRIGDTMTVNISRASSSFTHRIEYYLTGESNNPYTAQGVGTSYSFTIPSAWGSGLSSSGKTAYCKVITYNGLTQVGSPSTKSFTVLPASSSSGTAPSVGTLSASQTVVYGTTSITLSLGACTAYNGATISNYTIKNGSGSTIYNSSTRPSSVSVTVSSSTSFYAVVRDSAGYSSTSNTVSVSVYSTSGGGGSTPSEYDYQSGSARIISAIRSTDTPSTIVVTYSGTTIKNRSSVALGYKKTTQSTYTYVTLGWSSNTVTNGSYSLTGTDTSSAYDFRLRVYDSTSSAQYSPVYTTSLGKTQISLGTNGTSVAIGGLAPNDQKFTCFLPAHFNDGATGINASDITNFNTQVQSVMSTAGVLTAESLDLSDYVTTADLTSAISNITVTAVFG